MPRYYASSSDSLSEVTCSVNCCCIWMFLVVLTIVPGFLLVIIGCPCQQDSSLNIAEDLCIDCAIIGDILLSIGGSVTVVGCMYYCCLNYCLKLSSRASARRSKLNRVPRVTITPNESMNHSCQMQTMGASAVVNHPEDLQHRSEYDDRSPCLSDDHKPCTKRGNYTTIKEEPDREENTNSIELNLYTDKAVGLDTPKRSMNEESSSLSSLFSDTVLNVGVESNAMPVTA